MFHQVGTGHKSQGVKRKESGFVSCDFSLSRVLGRCWVAALPASSVLVQLLLWFCHRAGVGDVSLQCGPCIKWPLLVCIHILDLRANSAYPGSFLPYRSLWLLKVTHA